MRVSAKADYAIRAAIELAAAGQGPVTGDRIAQAQEIPSNFLENILGDLRNAGLVASRRGADRAPGGGAGPQRCSTMKPLVLSDAASPRLAIETAVAAFSPRDG